MTAMPTDGLALPISFDARYGAGAKRAIVLGGGGIAAVSWQVAYLDELARRGLEWGHAELIVGTSAGSVVGSLLAAGRIGMAAKEISLLTKAPSILSAMAPMGDFAPSQLRALEMFRRATDADPDTVRAIGRAALAAQTPPARHLPRALFAVTRTRKWGSAGLRIVCVDAYSGERLVLGRHSVGVPVLRAAAASASVPGVFSPQPIGDRKCVDGGVAGSATHSDVVAGALRVLVLPLAAGVQPPGMFCQRPDSLERELRRLRASGSRVEARVPDLPDLATDSLMDPKQIPALVRRARAQAAAESVGLNAFWNE